MFRMSVRTFAVLLGILVLLITTTAAPAGETGVLMLTVLRCSTSNPIQGAAVDVILYRTGVGQIDSASGTTTSTGYVEFTFDDLEPLDQARVTITPSGESPDQHTFYWIVPDGRTLGHWDVNELATETCNDGLVDKSGVIRCYYE